MKKIFSYAWRAAILVLIVAVAYIAWTFWRQANERPIEERYQFEKIRRGELVQSVTANGTLNPLTLVSVGTQVSGTVKAIRADFNDQVKEGQVLLELDATTFRAAIEQSSGEVSNAQAQLKLAMAEEARMRQLFAQEYVSRQDLDRALQGRETAQALLRTALGKLSRDRANLAYTVIRSPISGVVVSREVDLGQTVAASFQTPTLFKIAKDLSIMRVDSNVAEADVGKIRLGQKVRLSVDAFPEQKFEGEVQQIRLNPITQQNVVTYNVVVHVQNKELRLLPGMTAYLNVLIDQRTDALMVPNAALRFKPRDAQSKESKGVTVSAKAEVKPEVKRGRGATVQVLREGKLQPVPLNLGIADSRFTEVLGGDIKADDKVAVEELAADRGSGGAQQPFRVRAF